MSIWTILWLMWIVAGVAIEIPALVNREDGDTLSEHIRKWFKVKDPRPTALTWIARGTLMSILIWFITHFFWEIPW